MCTRRRRGLWRASPAQRWPLTAAKSDRVPKPDAYPAEIRNCKSAAKKHPMTSSLVVQGFLKRLRLPPLLRQQASSARNGRPLLHQHRCDRRRWKPEGGRFKERASRL